MSGFLLEERNLFEIYIPVWMKFCFCWSFLVMHFKSKSKNHLKILLTVELKQFKNRGLATLNVAEARMYNLARNETSDLITKLIICTNM